MASCRASQALLLEEDADLRERLPRFVGVQQIGVRRVGRLPVVGHREVDRALSRLGLVAVRQRGSRVVYRHADGRTRTEPHYGGRDIAATSLRKIPDDVGVSPEVFIQTLRS